MQCQKCSRATLGKEEKKVCSHLYGGTGVHSDFLGVSTGLSRDQIKNWRRVHRRFNNRIVVRDREQRLHLVTERLQKTTRRSINEPLKVPFPAMHRPARPPSYVCVCVFLATHEVPSLLQTFLKFLHSHFSN